MMHILLALSLLAATSKPVMHFFYTPDCGHCMDILLEQIPRLRAKFLFTFEKYDINDLKNLQLLEKMEENVENPGDDLPVIFLGDSIFYGPVEAAFRLEPTLKTLAGRQTTQRDTLIPPTDTGALTPRGEINIYYFYQAGCRECDRVDILLAGLARDMVNVKVHSWDIFETGGKIFFEYVAEQNNIPADRRLIAPTIVIGGDFLIDREINFHNTRRLLEKYHQGSRQFAIRDTTAAEQSIIERFKRFSILGIMIAGLIDGVNPCAFATLVFFVSYMLFIGRKRRDILIMAISFIGAVFVVYYAIGVGTFGVLKYMSHVDWLGSILFFGFGIFSVILGILSLRDYFLARRGEFSRMLLQLPLGIKRQIHKSIKEKTAVGGIVIGSMIAGFLVSILEFGCTGQVYLPTITFMVTRAGGAVKPLLALFLYNLMFVLPLVAITVIASFFSTKPVAGYLADRIPLIKIITAFLFFGLGALLLLSA